MAYKYKSVPLKMDSDYLRHFSFTNKLSCLVTVLAERNTVWKIVSVSFFLAYDFHFPSGSPGSLAFPVTLQYMFFKAPFLTAPSSHYKMSSKSLNLIFPKIDTCNAKLNLSVCIK